MYYTFITLWILSYEDEFKKYASNPKNLFIYNIMSILKKLAREKLTRIALKIFKNLSKYEKCVSLMIDNNLLGFLTMELRKNIKD